MKGTWSQTIYYSQRHLHQRVMQSHQWKQHKERNQDSERGTKNTLEHWQNTLNCSKLRHYTLNIQVLGVSREGLTLKIIGKTGFTMGWNQFRQHWTLIHSPKYLWGCIHVSSKSTHRSKNGEAERVSMQLITVIRKTACMFESGSVDNLKMLKIIPREAHIS